MKPASSTATQKAGRLPITVQMTVEKVTLPVEKRAAYRRGIAGMYAELERLVELDKAKARFQEVR